MGFHWACTIITWIAFGFCIRVTQILRDRVDDISFDEPDTSPIALPLEVRFGNAVWLLLVSAVSSVPPHFAVPGAHICA